MPLLVVYKETISRTARWTGPGRTVSVVEAGRGLLHASVCAPKQFRFPDSLEGPDHTAGAASAYLRHDARYNVQRLWGSCHLTVQGLSPGTLYAFRLRETLQQRHERESAKECARSSRRLSRRRREPRSRGKRLPSLARPRR